jgi:hypothetical protein
MGLVRQFAYSAIHQTISYVDAYIECDRCGLRVGELPDKRYPERTESGGFANEQGWVAMPGGRWLCPDCAREETVK